MYSDEQVSNLCQMMDWDDIPNMYPGLLRPFCEKTCNDSSRVEPSRRSKAARPDRPLRGLVDVTCNPSARISSVNPFNATATISTIQVMPYNQLGEDPTCRC